MFLQIILKVDSQPSPRSHQIISSHVQCPTVFLDSSVSMVYIGGLPLYIFLYCILAVFFIFLGLCQKIMIINPYYHKMIRVFPSLTNGLEFEY